MHAHYILYSNIAALKFKTDIVDLVKLMKRAGWAVLRRRKVWNQSFQTILELLLT